jgi:RNA polymerase sigma-70 factor (ECF subfamily)
MSAPGDWQRAPNFPSTHWSRVVQSTEGSSLEVRAALDALCSAYWYPLYAFIRHRGHGPDQAADLVQALFAHLLERNAFAAADRCRGRLRTYLLAVCRNFLADHDDERRAKKRGGGRTVLSIDRSDAEGRYRAEPADTVTPDRLFERAWALALLERVLGQLRREYETAGKRRLFVALEPALAGTSGEPLGVIATSLGMSEGSVQVAVHRLRRRYRELIREEIASTIDDPAAVEDEIRDLFSALKP